jgi:hypothetical protein
VRAPRSVGGFSAHNFFVPVPRMGTRAASAAWPFVAAVLTEIYLRGVLFWARNAEGRHGHAQRSGAAASAC